MHPPLFFFSRSYQHFSDSRQRLPFLLLPPSPFLPRFPRSTLMDLEVLMAPASIPSMAGISPDRRRRLSYGPRNRMQRWNGAIFTIYVFLLLELRTDSESGILVIFFNWKPPVRSYALLSSKVSLWIERFWTEIDINKITFQGIPAISKQLNYRSWKVKYSIINYAYKDKPIILAFLFNDKHYPIILYTLYQFVIQ